MKKTIIILFFLCYGFLSSAQSLEENSIKKTFNIKAGLSTNLQKDRNFSSHNFYGLIPEFGFSYQRKSDKNLIRSALHLNYGAVKYNSTLFKTDYYQFNFKTAYAHNISANNKLKNYLGAQSNNQVHLLNYNGFSNASLSTYLSLDVLFHSAYKLNEKHQLSLDFSYPILAYVVRPPYAGFDAYFSDSAAEGKIAKLFFTKGIISSGIKLIHPELDLGYAYNLSNKIDLKLNCGFYFLQYNPNKNKRNPKPVESIQNNLSFALIFKL